MIDNIFMKHLILLCLFIMVPATFAAPLQPGMIDDDFPVLNYSGTWNTGTNTIAYGGNYRYTNDATATLSYELSGNFTLYFIYDPNGAPVEICIDAITPCTALNTTGAVARGSVEVTGLDNSLHTITVQKTAADGLDFRFDALYVHPEPEVIVPNTLYESFDYDGTNYTGEIHLTISAGEVAMIVLLVVIAVNGLIRFVMEAGGE